MKKAVLAVLSLLLVFSVFFGCGKDENNNGESVEYDYDSVLTDTSVPLDIGSVIGN